MPTLRHIKRTSFIVATLLLFSVCLFAQGNQNQDTKPGIIEQSNKKLNPKSQNVKTLFEKTHEESLTIDQFKSYMASSPANLAKWEKVLEQFKNNKDTDTTYLREMIAAMKQKVQSPQD